MPDDDTTTRGPVGGPETSNASTRDGETSAARSSASGAPGADSGAVEDETAPVDGPDGDEEADEDAQDGPDEAPDDEEDRGDRSAREAARRRRELREVRADRDRLAGIVERFQRRDVEALVVDRLVDPGDVWRDGLDLGEVVGEDGTVDAAKLAAVVDGLVAAHPHWAPRPPGHRAMGGGGNGRTSSDVAGSGTRGLRDAFAAVGGRGGRG